MPKRPPHVLATDALNPHGTVALLTGESSTALAQGRRTLGIIEGDAVPQRFIPDLIELYLAGEFPFDRLVKFYDFGDINARMISPAESTFGATSIWVPPLSLDATPPGPVW